MDPPYQGVCGERDSRYLSGIQYHEFVDALRGLNSQGISYIVSYDGRTNSKTFGERLPDSLHLTHVELEAGRSTQATLLGRKEITFESLYISPSLMNRLKHQPIKHKPIHKQQYSLLENTPQYA
jgi:DNA adenine methylase